ncbi:MAG: hypothetical protein ACTSQI_06095 [Candidatus Helarchaeota archaeon]
MPKKAATKVAWLCVPLLAIITMPWLLPIFRGLWVNIFGLDIMYLGYIFVTIAVIAAVVYFIVDSGNWKLLCYVVCIFAVAIALELLWPYWYETNWFA